eukprot:GEZU01009844.1.p1 GENE.GEZU01009844.1~~GEZU01009844.1.p1  ORF type:complete len:191 (-),score=39.04 GEZU01009844.1:258-830(-)
MYNTTRRTVVLIQSAPVVTFETRTPRKPCRVTSLKKSIAALPAELVATVPLYKEKQRGRKSRFSSTKRTNKNLHYNRIANPPSTTKQYTKSPKRSKKASPGWMRHVKEKSFVSVANEQVDLTSILPLSTPSLDFPLAPLNTNEYLIKVHQDDDFQAIENEHPDLHVDLLLDSETGLGDSTLNAILGYLDE